MNTQTPEVGDRVRDKVTGFVGIAIGKTQWLTGCDTLTVRSEKLHEGKPMDTIGLDVTQAEVVKKAVIALPRPASPIAAEAPVKPGGPRPTVRQHQAPAPYR